MTQRIIVSFDGEGAGTGDLTWAQAGIWNTISQIGASKTMSGIVALTNPVTVDDAAATLRYVMERHPSLRTRLRIAADGTATQEQFTSGEVGLDVVDVDDEADPGADPGADPAEVAAAVRARYEATDFDYENEWPIRMAVVRKDGVLTHSVAVYLHTAVDAFALDELIGDLARMGAGPSGPSGPVRPAGIQPIELARRQRTPAVRRQGEASLRYLERVLRTIAPNRFPDAPRGPEPVTRMLRYRSPAALLAARAVAARDGVNSSAVLLGAYAVALARITGNNPSVIMVVASNRFRPGFAGSVSPLAQTSPCVVDVAGISVGDAVVRARTAAMVAYKHAYYPPLERFALMDAIDRERGEPIDLLSCFFNDRRGSGRDLAGASVPGAADIAAAVGRGELRWVDYAGAPRDKLYVDIDDGDDGDGDGAIEFGMTADVRYLPAAGMAAFIRDVEAVAVAAAVDPGMSTGIGVAGIGAAVEAAVGAVGPVAAVAAVAAGGGVVPAPTLG